MNRVIHKKHFFNYCYSGSIERFLSSPFSCIEEQNVYVNMNSTIFRINLFLRI